LEFIPQKANVVFLGTAGLGKTHLATALAYAACLEGHSVLFTDAIAVVNDLTAAQQVGNLKRAIKKYLRPAVTGTGLITERAPSLPPINRPSIAWPALP
jgi:DNA replication protein DnaC